MSTEWTPFRLDLAIEDARPASARVPEGFYLVECEGCEHPVKNPSTGSIGVWFMYRIVQGPDANPNAGIGGRLRDYNNLFVPGKARNHFSLTGTLVALDLANVVQMFASASEAQQTMATQETANRVFDNISAQARGRQAVADIRDRAGTNYSTIDALSSVAEWVNLRKAASYTAPNGPVSYTARPAGPGAGPAQAAANDLFADLDRQI
jgi:hypothetical protein